MADGPRLRLGLIGLGVMGVPIARRLLAKGWRLTVWDNDPARHDPLKKTGAKWADTPGAVRAASDLVLISVSGDEAMEEICFGEGGLASTRGAHIVIDLSTTGAEVTQRAAGSLDVAWLDSPVSGGPEGVDKGELTLMVGGTGELFDWVRPVLNDIANNVTLMGPLGTGQTAMMINQAIVGTNYVLMAEIVAQVRAAGIDPEKLVRSLKGGMGDSTMLQQVFPQMAGRSFEPARVPAARTLEDLQAVRIFNEANGLTLPVQEIAIDQFRHFAEDGDGDADSAAIVTLYDGDAE